MQHKLKTLPEFFSAIVSKEKNFECRYDDRCFNVGDSLMLYEYDGKDYTGVYCIRRVTYILRNFTGLKEGYVIMALTEWI